MHKFILAGLIMVTGFWFKGTTSSGEKTPLGDQAPSKTVTIIYPKQGQKVRGETKIYGKAKPGAPVKLYITSTYFKTAHKGEKITKAEGPLNRMNRVFNITADKNGSWALKPIYLTNTGWEENFTIRAVSENHSVSVNVFDHTKPVLID